jgi:hypothetical protein
MKLLFRIRNAGGLGAVFVLLLAGSSRGQFVTVDFEGFSGMSFFGGTPVPGSAQLSSQLLSSHGLLFSSDSGSPFVAVVALGANHATSGVNGIGGVDRDGLLSYGTALRIEFFLPSNPAVPAATDFFSVRGDLIANGNHPVTLEAFDVSGGLLGRMTQIDSQPWTLRVLAFSPSASAKPQRPSRRRSTTWRSMCSFQSLSQPQWHFLASVRWRWPAGSGFADGAAPHGNANFARA